MAAVPRFQLHDPDLMRRLMKRTGDGSSVSIRDLAEVAGVHPSHVGEILSGAQQTARIDVAAAIAARIGVDFFILWVPYERTAQAASGAARMRQVV